MNAHPEIQEDEFVRQIREAVETVGQQLMTVEYARAEGDAAEGASAQHVWDLTIRTTAPLDHPYDEGALRAALAGAHVHLVRAFTERRTTNATETLIMGRWRESQSMSRLHS